MVLTKNGEMTTLHSTHKKQLRRCFAPQTLEADENDENGGCVTHAKPPFAKNNVFATLRLGALCL